MPPQDAQHIDWSASLGVFMLQGVSAALEDRAGGLDIPLPAIVAEDSIMANAQQSRRKDMQAEAPDELQGRKGYVLAL